MKVPLQEIGDEGITLTGALPRGFLDLGPGDLCRSNGEVTYTIHLEQDGEAVIATGLWSAPVNMTCARCGERFDDVISQADWQGEFPLEKDQTSVDIGQLLREDILLSLPEYPRCDRGVVVARACPLDSYSNENAPEIDGGKDSRGNGKTGPWETLDNLDIP